MRFWICLIFLFCCISNAFSFNSENHRLITQRAIELLQQKYGNDYLSENEIKRIIKGNLSEERLNFKSIIRPYNRHYFNPDKDPSIQKNMSSINFRFDRLIAEFYGNHGSDNYDRSIGEIIHFIQDAASPAHVLPIDHCNEKMDAFDSQELGSLLPNELMEEKFLQCTMEYPQYLLKRLSRKTLENIDNKFFVFVEDDSRSYEDSLSWTSFWQKDSTQWFGSYGFLGESADEDAKDNFLKSDITKDGKIYHIESVAYNEFTKKQLDLAVLYTARFIYFAKSLIGEDGELVVEAEG